MNTCFAKRFLRPSLAVRLLPGLAALFSLQASRAELLLYEGFNYPAGAKLAQTASTNTWENNKDQITIISGSLDYVGLKKPSGNRVNFKPTAPNVDGVRTVAGAWKEQFGGALYVSFILRLQSVAGLGSTGEGTTLLTIGHTSNSSQLLGINVLNDGTVRLGVLKYPSDGASLSSSAFFTNGTGASLSIDGSTTYLVVAKYEWVEGTANDEVTLWVNPTNLGGGEDSGNKISIRTGADGDKSAGRLTLSRGPNVNLDELRIGQTWAEVTPADEPSHQWIMVMVLAGGLVIAGLWIAQLRRNVRERSAALQAQIQERQKAEHQRLVEQERARIAHDLHDELGADITEISMLATRAQGEGGEEGRRCLEQMTDKTRQMVGKLEEIVWAMDPQHDSLGALVSYLSFFADRFLGLANIKLSIDTSENAASLVVEARVRHQLFLVFKEALANLVRHSGASEVRLAVHVEDRALHVVVTDNGCGLRKPDPTSGAHEGIANMRRRIDKLGGQFEIAGEPGQGTKVKFSVPLNR
jgi:signal transduction histidine kinase